MLLIGWLGMNFSSVSGFSGYSNLCYGYIYK
jgi:hypothetical protein